MDDPLDAVAGNVSSLVDDTLDAVVGIYSAIRIIHIME